MCLRISTHAYVRMAELNILPGEADEVVADPDWSGERPSGNCVLGKDGLAVVVRGGVIVTAYRLMKGRNNGANRGGLGSPARRMPQVQGYPAPHPV